jgi:hypothetical protein
MSETEPMMSYFHPERMPVLPARRREAARRQLEQLVGRSAKAPRIRRARPAVIAAGAAAAIALSTGAAAFAVARYEAVTDRSQARCYTVATTSDSHYVSVGEPGRAGRTAQVRTAVGVCASLFRAGLLRPGAKGIDPSAHGGAGHPVPRLVACTLSGGVAAVFPGGPGTCARLGLPAAAMSRRHRRQ